VTRRTNLSSISYVTAFFHDSSGLWHLLLCHFGLPDIGPQPDSTNFFDWWLQATNSFNKEVKRGFNLLVSLGAWILWKGRNDRVFNGISPNLSRALLLASEEVDLWILASAKGLRRLRSLVAVRNGG